MSMRDRPGDEDSRLWRGAQYEGMRQIYDQYRGVYGPRPGTILQGTSI